MSSKLVQDVLSSLTADKDWPKNVLLYKSLEEQELLPEVARCCAIEALLAVHGLQENFSIRRRHNAEYMAPKNGRLPFLRIENTVISEDEVVKYLQKKEFIFNVDLTVEENLCLKGVLSLLETKLIPIELYYLWVDTANVEETFKRYGFNQPQPLKNILCLRKQQEIRKYLQVTGYLKKSHEEIKEEVKRIFKLLSEKLEKNKYIIGEQISDADIFVYGHLQAIIESKLHNNVLLNTLQNYPKLINFCLNFNQVHLRHQAMLWEFV